MPSFRFVRVAAASAALALLAAPASASFEVRRAAPAPLPTLPAFQEQAVSRDTRASGGVSDPASYYAQPLHRAAAAPPASAENGFGMRNVSYTEIGRAASPPPPARPPASSSYAAAVAGAEQTQAQVQGGYRPAGYAGPSAAAGAAYNPNPLARNTSSRVRPILLPAGAGAHSSRAGRAGSYVSPTPSYAANAPAARPSGAFPDSRPFGYASASAPQASSYAAPSYGSYGSYGARQGYASASHASSSHGAPVNNTPSSAPDYGQPAHARQAYMQPSTLSQAYAARTPAPPQGSSPSYGGNNALPSQANTGVARRSPSPGYYGQGGAASSSAGSRPLYATTPVYSTTPSYGSSSYGASYGASNYGSSGHGAQGYGTQGNPGTPTSSYPSYAYARTPSRGTGYYSYGSSGGTAYATPSQGSGIVSAGASRRPAASASRSSGVVKATRSPPRRSLADFETVPSAADPGFYWALRTGLTLPSETHFTSGTTRYSQGYEPGWTLGGALGYGFAPVFSGVSPRAELEVSYSRANVDKQTGGGASFTGTNAQGTTDAWRMFVNLYLDLDALSVRGLFTPYVGAGLGGAMVDFDRHGTGTTLLASDDTGGFAWNAGAGISFPVFGPDTKLDLGYRYARVTDTKVQAFSGSSSRTDMGAHELILGLRQSFTPDMLF